MNNDLISREALLKALKSNCKPEICHDYGTNWCEACCPHNDFEDLIDNAPTTEVPENAVNCVLTMFGNCSYNKTGCYDCEIKDKIHKALNERPQGEFTDLERKVTADAINYLLGAELLEENGYTEEVINALKSVLQKIGAEEYHL